MWQWLEWLFRGWVSANKVAEKALPSDKLREEKFELDKPVLEEKQFTDISDERNKLFDEFFQDLRRHPELSIENKVNFELPNMSERDRQLLIEQLTARLNSDELYLRKKNKKSKFKL